MEHKLGNTSVGIKSALSRKTGAFNLEVSKDPITMRVIDTISGRQ